ncbi:MAG TPA: type II secretion system GspH family protein [Victivallis vadensis]|nr:type II secretion system GspH family protein [Victivallis vadensis]
MKFSQKVVCGVLKNGNAPPIVHIRENSQQWKQAENDETVGPDMNKRTKRNFTLIELLVVMLLMGVLMTLMLPAFKRMITGDQVQQLSSNLKLGLEQAQSHAITSRRYVALILPNPQMGKNKDQWLGGYRMAYVDRKRSDMKTDETTGKPIFDRTPKWIFKGWVPDSTWKAPVAGAKLLLLVKGDDPSAYDQFKEGESLDITIPATISAIEMNPLLKINDYIPEADSTNKSDVDHAAIIFSPYGGIIGAPGQADDYHNLRLAIVECLENGNNLIFPSRDTQGKPTNYLVLEVNRFTGRTKYHQPK